jgi:hypothetical protein
MTNVAAIVSHLLEDEDEELDVKGAENEVTAGPTTVKRVRRTRMKIVDMRDFTFLISYLTPVAYLDKSTGIYYQTKKQFSPTTNVHIGEWEAIIADSPEWKADPAHNKKDIYGDREYAYVERPRFKLKRQAQISSLFRELMKSMRITPREKRRLYYVPPTMRQGSTASGGGPNWPSGHGKFHDAGEDALPRPTPYSSDVAGFFSDFNPDDPEYWDWSSGLRNMEPHEDQ